MAFISYTSKERDLLARLMRAEALGEGNLGMLMVGNVGVNRVIGDCLDFIPLRSVEQMVFQSPGGFVGVNSPLFYGNPTALEKNLANRVLRGEDYHPATNALWFYAPKTGEVCTATWFSQANSGRYKNHCFYQPSYSRCPRLY